MKLVLVALCFVLLQDPAAAFTAVPPCNERRMGPVTVRGVEYQRFLIRPRAGTRCRFNTSIGNQNVMLLAVRVTKRPDQGRLIRATRAEVIYQAGSGGDSFGLAFRVRNRHGEGWYNIAVAVRPR